jgi:uncharacterized lipoprotein YehR (DUF1307 family)
MKTHLKIIKFITVFGIVLSLTSCGNDNDNGDNKKDTTVNVTDINQENLITYLIPSPKDMFGFTKEGQLKFSAAVLNKKENADKYLDTKSKELGFGLYSADLAYTAAFNQTNTAGEYLKIVESLSDKIGLGSVFTEALVSRFKNIESKDSLLKVTNDTYYEIVKHLEENDRNTTLSLISVGGWVETLFIVTNLQGKFKADDEIIQLIADQKNIFENMMLSLEQRQGDEIIGTVIKDLKPIESVYDELEVVNIENPEKVSPKGNQILVGGTTKIMMTEEQFNKLKRVITEVRNKFANANF